MYCVHCGANLGPADLYCTRCGKPKVEAPPEPVSTPASAPTPSPPGIELPPNLHWGLVLLLQVVTCGIFWIVWAFVQANWAKKLDPGNKSAPFIGAYAVGFLVAMVLSVDKSTELLGSVANIIGGICGLIGAFKIRASMEEYYNSTENIGLDLGGVMTFFFSVIYFQYHINRIARWKTTGVL